MKRIAIPEGDIRVSRGQWQSVRAILLSHDPARIAPLIRDREGITCIRWWRDLGHTETSSYHLSKREFLQSLTRGKFEDRAGVFTGEPDQVYAWLWVALKQRHPEVARGPRTWQIKPARARSEKPLAEVAFISEEGRLKISKISAYASGD